MNGKLFVLSAPSGAGKTTLVNELIKKLPSLNINRVITYTTKNPRKGEIHGVDYHFINEEEFKTKIQQGFFLEWSNAYGSYYGSPRYILEEIKSGKSYIAILDQFGAMNIKSIYVSSILIWIMPPNIEELKNRLLIRGNNNDKEIEFRLNLAKKELEMLKIEAFDYSFVNVDFEFTLKELENAIIKELTLKS